MKDQGFKLDAIVTVIDCLNFKGYEDTSYTAKMQAKYTDITLLNKHELVSESELESVLDHVYGLNADAPVLRCHGKLGVDPDVVFGLDSQLFSNLNQVNEAESGRIELSDHQDREVDLIQVIKDTAAQVLDRQEVEKFFCTLKAENFYRIKGSRGNLLFLTLSDVIQLFLLLLLGMMKTAEGFCLANFAFGRPDWTTLSKYESNREVQFIFMGTELAGSKKKIQEFFGATDAEITLHQAHRH